MIAAAPTLNLIAVLATVATVIMIIAGVYMVWRGATGGTRVKMLGADVSAQNVGVACVACGLLLLVFVLRPIIQAIVDIARI